MRPVGGDREVPVRRAHRRGDEPRSRGRGRGAALPRGPLLPHQRRAHRRCRRCARAAATCSLLAQHFLEQFARAERQATSTGSRRAAAEKLARLRLARATCASSRTASSAPWRSRASSSSPSTICPEKIRDLPPRDTSSSRATIRPSSSRMEEVERRYILRVLEAVGGNKTRRGAGARLRPQDALPQARALRRRAGRQLASTGCRRPESRDGEKSPADQRCASVTAAGGARCPERPHYASRADPAFPAGTARAEGG